MSGFAQALEQEISILEAELEADTRFVKLRELRRVRALYEPSNFDKMSDRRKVTWNEAASEIRNISARQATLYAAVDYIRGRNIPTKTAEIYEHVARLGHVIGGAEPKSNLSAMLHNSPLFKSHGRTGWTLAEQDGEESSDGAEEPSANTAEPDATESDDPFDDMI